MRKDHGTIEEPSTVLLQTLELLLVVLGLAVLQSLGTTLLMPMLIGLVIFFPCAFALRLLKGHRDC